MKKLFPTIIALLCTICLSAQTNWSIGIESGLISSGIENQNPYGISKLPSVKTSGMSHSLVFSRTIKPGLSIQLAPTYMEMGQNYIDQRNQGDYIRNISLDYISVPLMLSKDFGSSKLKINAQGGFCGSYLLRSQYDESTLLTEASIPGPINTEVNSDRFNSLDLGFRAGLGATVDIIPALTLKARYSVLSSITDLNSDDYIYQPEYKLEYKKSRNVASLLNLGVYYNF